MIIFFDWVDDDGAQEGISDHVGIVEKFKGGRVYTIEGNSGKLSEQSEDNLVARQRNSYPIGYFEIMGYGTPKYESGGTANDSENNGAV